MGTSIVWQIHVASQYMRGTKFFFTVLVGRANSADVEAYQHQDAEQHAVVEGRTRARLEHRDRKPREQPDVVACRGVDQRRIRQAETAAERLKRGGADGSPSCNSA